MIQSRAVGIAMARNGALSGMTRRLGQAWYTEGQGWVSVARNLGHHSGTGDGALRYPRCWKGNAQGFIDQYRWPSSRLTRCPRMSRSSFGIPESIQIVLHIQVAKAVSVKNAPI